MRKATPWYQAAILPLVSSAEWKPDEAGLTVWSANITASAANDAMALQPIKDVAKRQVVPPSTFRAATI